MKAKKKREQAKKRRKKQKALMDSRKGQQVTYGAAPVRETASSKSQCAHPQPSILKRIGIIAAWAAIIAVSVFVSFEIYDYTDNSAKKIVNGIHVPLDKAQP